MNDILQALLALTGGLAGGAIFFGGLWWTISKFHQTSYLPAILLLSFILRAAVALGIIWWLGRNNLVHLAACLVGFLAARIILVRKVGPDREGTTLTSKENLHAPEP